MRGIRSRYGSTCCAAALLVASFAAGAPAQAQDGKEDSEQEVIVVTASKTGAQDLQSVPLAIQAFTGEELKLRNIGTLDDLVSTIPGAFEGFRQSASSRIYNIRGAVSGNGDSPIGYYLDEVPFIVTNFGIAPPVRFLDMDRVEVLRGPQGTLYGQGTSGGVFIFHTRDPNLTDLEYAGEAEVSQTEDAGDTNYGVAGAVSVPVVRDRFAVRISGGHSVNPGWADVYYGPFDGTPDEEDVNEIKNDDVRLVALFKPADNITLRGQYWRFQPRQTFTGFTASVDPPYFQNTAGQPSFSDGDFKLMSFSATIDFEGFSLTSATSRLEGGFGINIPISPAGFFSSQFFPEMFAQEFRANSTGEGPLHWVVGAAYQDGEGPQDNQLEIPPFVSIDADNNTLTENWALFGEVSYELFDGKLVPLLGLRTYHDDRAFEDATDFVPTEEDVNTWRAALTYLPTDDLTMFISAATGFRPGIVQSQVQVQSLELAGIPASVALEPETSTNYEAAIRWRSPDRSLSLGVNLYQLEYTNLQTNTPGAIQGVNGFTNFGDATSKGVDLEAQWETPIEGLTLSAVGNFNDSSYDTVNPVVQTVLPLLQPGSRLINTLDQNYRFDVSYSRDITPNLQGFGNIGYSHNGDRLQGNGLTVDPYDLFNATIGVRSGRYELAFIGSNLSDERGPTFLGTNGPQSGSGPTPRTLGLRLRVTSQ
jgi:outer membrane receptor protein involved in Fe transport